MKPSDRQMIIIISVVALTALPSYAACGATIFHDSFADGNAEDGHPVTWQDERMAPGRYDASSGDYVLSNGRVMISTIPGLAIADTSIRTRGRITGTGSPGDFVGVGVRRGSVFGYAAGVCRTGMLDIIRVDPNFRPNPLANTRVDFNSVDQDVMVQLDAVGDQLSVWAWPAGEPMPSQPQLSARDATYGTGTPGIAAFVPSAGEAIFRFVHVADTHLGSVAGDFSFDTTLSVDDVDELSSAIRAGQANTLYDVNADGAVDSQDLNYWVHDLKTTWFGDANLDGEFSSMDVVAVLKAGQYQDEIVGNSGWATGDWNGDAEFTRADLVLALQDAGYQQGTRAAVTSVAEPSSVILLVIGMIALYRYRRSR